MSCDRLSGAMAGGGDAGNDSRVDAGLIEKWALNYLGRFASSAANLRRVLLRRARRSMMADAEPAPDIAPLIDALIVRYRATGLIDDSAYAAAQVRAGLRRGQSLRTVRAKLAAKGVGAGEAAQGIDTAAGPRGGVPHLDLAAACTFARRRRFGPFRPGPADDDIRMRELAAFGRAGFDRATAEAVLGCADPEEVAALLAGEG